VSRVLFLPLPLHTHSHLQKDEDGRVARMKDLLGKGGGGPGLILPKPRPKPKPKPNLSSTEARGIDLFDGREGSASAPPESPRSPDQMVRDSML
jgi:hypothetical protein